MQRLNRLYLFMAAVACIAIISSCDKTKPYKVIESIPQVHFNNTMNASSKFIPYYVTNSPTSTYTLTVGTTDVSDEDRVVGWKVSSPSGAVAGTHYSMVTTGNTVTIPAGKTSADIVVHGIFAPYGAGTRKDTLWFTLQQPAVEVAGFSDTVKLVLQRYCDVVLTAFTGNYIAQDYYNGAPDGGPYTVSLGSATSTGTNTASIQLSGLWGVSLPIVFNIDWNNPANFSTAVPTQLWFIDATYGQVTTRPNGTGTFSSCDNTFTIGYENTVAAGTFGKYITTLKK